MKVVKEILYEKFSDKTDPIQDMGIGGVNLGRLRSQLFKEYRQKFIDSFKEMLLNKNVTCMCNEVFKVSRNNKMIDGDGWKKRTIHIDRISEFDENASGLSVYDDTKKASYRIGFEDEKIFIEE